MQLHGFIKNIIPFLGSLVLSQASAQNSAQLAQYPSPMQETVRKHERITFNADRGTVITLDKVLAKPVTVYLPAKIRNTRPVDMLFHFHGASNLVAYAADQYKGPLIAVSVNLGSGSSVYANPFNNDSAFAQLKQSILDTVRKHLGHSIVTRRIIVSGFSAGYGAIRSILLQPVSRREIDAVLLLDGLRASYIPERKVLAEGGLIDSISLMPFIQFAREAANSASGKKFLFTHSEIFPGTFASTTETAGYLLKQLNVKASPVLKWGPLGMQQISEASKGHATVLGFAGNTVPDHIDHLHGLYYFLNKL